MRLLLATLCAVLGASQAQYDCTAYWTDVNTWASRASRDPVCPDQFEGYNDCMASKIEDEVNNVIAESNVAAQTAVNSDCFSGSGNCGKIDFKEASVLETFLPCPDCDATCRANTTTFKDKCMWRYAARVILDILDDTPKSVGKCMIRFFKGIGKRKIEKCTRDYGNIDPPFVQPSIQGFEDFELEDLKNVLSYHVMTRYKLGKCTNCNVNGHNTKISCVAGKAVENVRDVCATRQECEDNTAGCENRYSKVRNSVCKCARKELKKGISALDGSELKRVFTRGDLECQMEDCYIQEGAPGWDNMYYKLQEMKIAVPLAVVQMTTGKAPKQLAEALVVFKNILGELVDKWQGLFCGSCNAGRGSAVEIRRKNLDLYLKSPGCKNANDDAWGAVTDDSWGQSWESEDKSKIDNIFADWDSDES